MKGSPQLPLALNVADKASIENFHTGDNAELVTAIQFCVENSETRILYFYGPKSSGKSHLLFAAMRLIEDKGLNSSYLSFLDSSIRPELLTEIKLQPIICLDNIDQWAGDDEKEAALFTLFEQIKHMDGSLIVSANKAPDCCGFELVDLISRLSSGLVYPLKELSEAQQREAIIKRAIEQGLVMSDDVVNYLLSRSSRNTGELFAILNKIDRVSLVEKRKVTIPFLQTIINL